MSPILLVKILHTHTAPVSADGLSIMSSVGMAAGTYFVGAGNPSHEKFLRRHA